MDRALTPGPAFHFGVYELDLSARRLRKNGHRIPLQEHSLKILAVLLERRGEVVTRQELQSKLWPDGTVVDFDNGLNAAMGKLRQALCDTADRPSYIETIPRQGYRFIGEAAVFPPLVPAEEESAPARSGFRRPKWLIAISIGAAVMLAALVFSRARAIPSRPAPPAGKPTLAVLPFVYLSPDPEGQYLADGMTEELTAQLSRLEPRNLAVIARTSAMAYRGSTKNIAQIGMELGADHLLEGSLRRSGDRVRVTAQLIQASDQTHLWAADYDRDFGDVLTVETEIALAVADRIHIVLSPPTSERLSSAKAVATEAHDAYLKGRYFLWNQEKTAGALAKSAAYFQEAIRIDPAYAAPYAALAEYHAVNEESPAGVIEEARLARMYAAKALALDDSLPEAHMSLGFMAAAFDRDWQSAEREFQRTFDLDPNLVRARAFHAVYLLAVGRPEDAVAEIHRAQQMDPLSLVLRHQTTRTLYLARHYQEAIEEAQRRLELNPSNLSLWGMIAIADIHLGRSKEALEALERGLSAAGARRGMSSVRARVYAAAGRIDQARIALAELREDYNRGALAGYWLAVGYAALGDRPEALTWLEKAYERNDPYVNLRLKQDPDLDPLRAEPRFQNLVKRMNYPK